MCNMANVMNGERFALSLNFPSYVCIVHVFLIGHSFDVAYVIMIVFGLPALIGFSTKQCNLSSAASHEFSHPVVSLCNQQPQASFLVENLPNHLF